MKCINSLKNTNYNITTQKEIDNVNSLIDIKEVERKKTPGPNDFFTGEVY